LLPPPSLPPSLPPSPIPSLLLSLLSLVSSQQHNLLLFFLSLCVCVSLASFSSLWAVPSVYIFFIPPSQLITLSFFASTFPLQLKFSIHNSHKYLLSTTCTCARAHYGVGTHTPFVGCVLSFVHDWTWKGCENV
jgi:hypothetical protein